MSVSSAIGLFGNPEVVPVSIPSYDVPISAVGNIASNTIGVGVLNFVVPKGVFYMLGYLSVETDGTPTNDIASYNAGATLDGVPICNVFGTTDEIIGTANFSGLLIASDGTAELTINCVAQVVGGTTYKILPTGINTSIKLLKVG
jgi:hypothetical protein